MDDGDVLVLVGTDFPYRDWYPDGQDRHPARRARPSTSAGARPCTHALVGDAARDARPAASHVSTGARTAPHLEKARTAYQRLARAAALAARPGPRRDPARAGPRAVLDNPDERIRPEARGRRRRPARGAGHDDLHQRHRHVDGVAVALRHDARHPAAPRLLQPRLDGQRACRMALGAQALDRTRQVVAFCGDGGLTMLLGDLRTAVTYQLPVDVRRLRQRPARHGQARAGAGRAAGVRHRARQPRPRRRRARRWA